MWEIELLCKIVRVRAEGFNGLSSQILGGEVI